MLCLAALLVYGCTDDSTSDSDNGAEATGARQNRDSVNEAALERVLAVMRMDRAAFDSITCEAPCSGMLSAEQEAVVTKIKRRVRGELRRGPEVEVAPGIMRHQDLIDVEILEDAVQSANINTNADLETWASGLDAEQRQFANRTIMILVNAWARASDLPAPYKVSAAAQMRPLTVGQSGQLGTQSYAISIDPISCPAVVGWGVGLIVTSGTAYDIANDVDITHFVCTNWDWKGYYRVCCGWVCVNGHDEGYLEESCTLGTKKADPNWEELDPDDCDEIVYPDMGPPDMDVPDMKAPDMGVEEQDAGEVPGNEQPSERQ
jgi:hypothetical protein